MAEAFLGVDDELSELLSKEREDVRTVGRETTETTTEVLEESQQLLEVYSMEQQSINKEADTSLSKLRASIDQYNALQNAGPLESIGNAFMGIFDPSKDINKVGQRVQQNQTQLKLAEVGRSQSQDKLNTGMQQGRAEMEIAGAQLSQEVRELELVKGEIAGRRAEERAKLESQQRFLTTQDPAALAAAEKTGQLTRQQVQEETDRRTRQKRNMRQLDINMQLQERGLAEATRQDFLQDMTKFEVQEALDESQKPENAGQFKLANFTATAPELKKRLEEFAAVDVATVGETIATVEAAAVSKTTAEFISRYTGVDTSDMDAVDAYSVMAKSPIWKPEEASAMRQSQALITAIEETPEGTSRAQLSEVLLKKSADIITMMNEKVRNKFPSKDTAVAIDQQLETGIIYDKPGAQQLTMTNSLMGTATGSNMYDDLLGQMRPASVDAATTPALAEIGAFQEEWVNASNKAVNFAYTTGIYETMALVANDPKYAQLNLATALSNRNSALYGGTGKFSMANLANYFNEAFGDSATAQWAEFQSAMAQHLDPYARTTFGYQGGTPEGSVAISSVNNQLFGNAPVRNFITQARTKLSQLGQSAQLVRD